MATQYEVSGGAQDDYWSSSDALCNGQTFLTTSAHTVTQVKLSINRLTATGNLLVSIRAVSGGVPVLPDLTSGSLDVTTLTADTYVTATVSVTEYSLANATTYAICILTDGDLVRVGGDSTAPYADGAAYGSGSGGDDGTWSLKGSSPQDFIFEIWGNTEGGATGFDRMRLSRSRTGVGY